jgi:hypothetical protein
MRCQLTSRVRGAETTSSQVPGYRSFHSFKQLNRLIVIMYDFVPVLLFYCWSCFLFVSGMMEDERFFFIVVLIA